MKSTVNENVPQLIIECRIEKTVEAASKLSLGLSFDYTPALSRYRIRN